MGRSLQRPGTARTVALGTAVTLLLGKRTQNGSRIINNIGPDTVYLAWDRSVTADSSFPLLPAQSLITDSGAEIWGVGSTALSLVGILEEP